MNSLRGIYQGKMNFFIYGLNIGIEGILRTIAGIIMIFLGTGVIGGLWASVISGLIAIYLLIFRNESYFIKNIFNLKFNNELIKEFIFALLTLLPFGLITALDLILVQYVIGGDTSGILATCSIFGKNMINLSLVLASVVFSYVLNKSESSLWYGIVVISLLFIILTIFMYFFGKSIILFLFGEKFIDAYKYLPLYILSMMPLAIIQQVVNFAIAKNYKFLSYFLWFSLTIMLFIYYYLLKNYTLLFFIKINIIVLSILSIIFIVLVELNKRKLFNKVVL